MPYSNTKWNGDITNITETESVYSPQLFSEPDNIQQERVVEPRRSKRFRIKPGRLDL